MTTLDPEPTDSPAVRKPIQPAIRRVGLALLAAGTAALAIQFAYANADASGNFVTTDNAYVRGDVTFVAPKVPGYVTAVLTENNRRVVPGQVLIEIDPTDYRASVADAAAAVAQQRAAIRQLGAQRALQQAQISIAEAGVLAAGATAAKTRADLNRTTALIGEGAVSAQLLDQARADNIKAGSGIAQARSQTEFARRQIAVIDAQSASARALLEGAVARLGRARADLARTRIEAPREGRIAARNVRVGEFVNTGTRLLAITPTTGLWIDANLRETQLGRIRSGDRVEVKVDALPGVTLCGTLDGIQGASGSDFAVLPPDNATGNFTKIVRRFTARIVLDPHQSGLERLASGMSVEPRIAVGSHANTLLPLLSGFGCRVQS